MCISFSSTDSILLSLLLLSLFLCIFIYIFLNITNLGPIVSYQAILTEDLGMSCSQDCSMASDARAGEVTDEHDN